MPGGGFSPATAQREGLRALRDSKPPREGPQTQAKAPLRGQRRMT